MVTIIATSLSIGFILGIVSVIQLSRNAGHHR
ncbi:hypothetical protein FB562_1277 [Homoserinimonas aerilata]|uniref:Uncharacterized protein n=1 Tax=Homoserinimonas aerilata TaxID=1162970 RepID=A0A542YJF4_9MICO|nr:hypothetical protein FB562_1277 [Homoserinimonas aerilata]